MVEKNKRTIEKKIVSTKQGGIEDEKINNEINIKFKDKKLMRKWIIIFKILIIALKFFLILEIKSIILIWNYIRVFCKPVGFFFNPQSLGIS